MPPLPEINQSLLVIIPAYNEERGIAEVVTGIRNESGSNSDILVINDGSSDATTAEALGAGAAVVDFPFNLGYGSALQAGYRYALDHGYDIVLQMDGDGQHDPSAILDLVEPIVNGRAKVVLGSRYLGQTSYAVPLVRRIGQSVFAFMLRLLTKKRVTDPTSGYQAIHRDVLSLYVSEEFPPDYPDVDVLLLLYYRGLDFCEVQASFHASVDGKSMHSGLKPLYYIIKMVLSMFLVCYRYRGAGPPVAAKESGVASRTESLDSDQSDPSINVPTSM